MTVLNDCKIVFLGYSFTTLINRNRLFAPLGPNTVKSFSTETDEFMLVDIK